MRRLSLRALKPGFGSILLWLRCLLADRNREQTSGPEGLARSAGILLGVETPGSLRNGSLWAVETAAFAGMGRSVGRFEMRMEGQEDREGVRVYVFPPFAKVRRMGHPVHLFD